MPTSAWGLVYASMTSSTLNAPGASCTVSGAASNNGSSFVICSGGVWVAQALTVGMQSGNCTTGLTGMMQWSGSTMQVCNGTLWQAVAHQ